MYYIPQEEWFSTGLPSSSSPITRCLCYNTNGNKLNSLNERHYHIGDNEGGWEEGLSLKCFGHPNFMFPDSDAIETLTFSYCNGLYNVFIDMHKSI